MNCQPPTAYCFLLTVLPYSLAESRQAARNKQKAAGSGQFIIYNQYCPNVQFGNPCKCKYGCELRVKMSKIDLNSDVLFGHFESCRRGVHEQWPNDFCAAHLSRESARHRNLLARTSVAALSHGLSRRHLAQHPGQRQPAARLAHLRRLCPSAHHAGPRPLSARTVGRGIGADGLRLRFHHRRSLLVAFPLGAVSAAQECGETSHLARSARQHSHRCLRDQRRGERCETSRSTGAGGGGLLSPRSRLCRLPASPSDHPSPGFLRHPCRAQHALPSLRTALGRSLHGPAFRSNHSPHRTQEFASLSHTPAAHSLLRRRERLAPDLSQQQFSTPGPDHRATLPGSLASRIVLPLDQTASANPGFLRHFGERREDPSVGGDHGLRPGGHLEKATGPRPEPTRNPANSEYHDFRKKPNFTGLFAVQRPNSRTRSLHPTGSVQLMMGQY